MRRRFTQSDINGYAEISGDRNPLHVDPAFAAMTPYRGTIAHGLLVAAYTAQDLARPDSDRRFIPYTVEVIFVRPVPGGGEVAVVEQPILPRGLPAEPADETSVEPSGLPAVNPVGRPIPQGHREIHAEVDGETAVVVRGAPLPTEPQPRQEEAP